MLILVILQITEKKSESNSLTTVLCHMFSLFLETQLAQDPREFTVFSPICLRLRNLKIKTTSFFF